jgi:hypothetical protein
MTLIISTYIYASKKVLQSCPAPADVLLKEMHGPFEPELEPVLTGLRPVEKNETFSPADQF